VGKSPNVRITPRKPPTPPKKCDGSPPEAHSRSSGRTARKKLVRDLGEGVRETARARTPQGPRRPARPDTHERPTDPGPRSAPIPTDRRIVAQMLAQSSRKCRESRHLEAACEAVWVTHCVSARPARMQNRAGCGLIENDSQSQVSLSALPFSPAPAIRCDPLQSSRSRSRRPGPGPLVLVSLSRLFRSGACGACGAQGEHPYARGKEGETKRGRSPTRMHLRKILRNSRYLVDTPK
jgi:hypothetical protein